MITKYCAVVLMTLTNCTFAADATSLAREFVQLQKYGDQYEDMYAKCIAGSKAAPPESFLSAEPDKFYGIRPGSKCWPRVVEAWEELHRSICATPTKKEFLKVLVTTYSEQLSPNDLKQAITFYSTKAGQRLVSTHNVASEKLTTLISNARAERSPVAIATFDRKLQAIASPLSEETDK